MALLEVEHLMAFFETRNGPVQAVDGVSFWVGDGENFGLVGESGCGKTTAVKALVRLLPPNGKIVAGKVNFKGRDLLSLSQEEMRRVRWQEISMISQSAMNALDPVYRVGWQIIEAIRAHSNMTRSRAMDRSRELFELVGLDPDRLNAYPHQLSGGMRQRAIIAMALALNPSLIIADEPTTALDVILQDQILRRIRALQSRHSSSMIVITHDFSVIAETCERTAVMYAGKIVEMGDIVGVLKRPSHPYTMGLKNAFPSVRDEKKELICIPGSPPVLINPPLGCRFFERCPFSLDICLEQEPQLVKVDGNQYAACHRVGEAEKLRVLSSCAETWEPPSEAS